MPGYAPSISDDVQLWTVYVTFDIGGTGYAYFSSTQDITACSIFDHWCLIAMNSDLCLC